MCVLFSKLYGGMIACMTLQCDVCVHYFAVIKTVLELHAIIVSVEIKTWRICYMLQFQQTAEYTLDLIFYTECVAGMDPFVYSLNWYCIYFVTWPWY